MDGIVALDDGSYLYLENNKTVKKVFAKGPIKHFLTFHDKQKLIEKNCENLIFLKDSNKNIRICNSRNKKILKKFSTIFDNKEYDHICFDSKRIILAKIENPSNSKICNYCFSLLNPLTKKNNMIELKSKWDWLKKIHVVKDRALKGSYTNYLLIAKTSMEGEEFLQI